MLQTYTLVELALTHAERDLLCKVLESYLSELRQEIAATKRDTGTLHSEEALLKTLLAKVAEAS